MVFFCIVQLKHGWVIGHKELSSQSRYCCARWGLCISTTARHSSDYASNRGVLKHYYKWVRGLDRHHIKNVEEGRQALLMPSNSKGLGLVRRAGRGGKGTPIPFYESLLQGCLLANLTYFFRPFARGLPTCKRGVWGESQALFSPRLSLSASQSQPKIFLKNHSIRINPGINR